MNNFNEKSTVIIKSNIIKKSMYKKDRQSYLPIDLLPKDSDDSRAARFLTPTQQLQRKKKLFYAKNIVDDL